LNILHGYGEYGSRYWKGRYDTVFDRMAALGLKFVGPQAPEGGRQADPWPKELPVESLNVPTFHTNRQSPATATRQLDFVFASESIADRVKVRALNSVEEWGPSDHCRVMIELEMKKIC
jgi:endonuclease/exonuclease/phosphatase family metal-dependent hydrolase